MHEVQECRHSSIYFTKEGLNQSLRLASNYLNQKKNTTHKETHKIAAVKTYSGPILSRLQLPPADQGELIS